MIRGMRFLQWAAILALVSLTGIAALHADSDTYFGFSIGIGDAPPPPRIVLEGGPRIVAIPETSVRLLANTGYDVFNYDEAYYCYNDGYWYRAKAYSGPYAVVDVRTVPRPILVVPAKHWKHHPHGGPPGQAKKHRR